MVRKLLALGARAYVVKNATREEVLAAVRAVHCGDDRIVLSVSRDTADRLEGAKKHALSARELEILLLTTHAMSNSQIASHLHTSEGTVKRHLKHLREAGRLSTDGRCKESLHKRANNVQRPL